MLYGGRDLKSLVEEGRQLEQELKLIESGQTTRESCEELVKFVKENERHDPLVVKNPATNVFQQPRKNGSSGVCC